MRTNCFRVTDEKKYQKFFNSLIGEDINDFTEERDGVLRHGFGGYGCVSYLNREETVRDLFKKYNGNVFNDDNKKIDLETALAQDVLFDEFGKIIFDENEEIGDFDSMTKAIQKLLPDGECFIYTQICYEKLRFVDSFTIVATNSEVRCESSENFIRKSIVELVGEENANNITKPYY